MKRILIISILSVVSLCHNIQAESDGYKYGEVVSKFVGLHEAANKNTSRENYFVRADNQFDANEYFGVLRHLSVTPEFLLDYVVMGQNGPFLYLRKLSEKRLKDYADCEEKFGKQDWIKHKNSHLDSIKTDGTPEGFFELIVLKELGGQFYLFWHANYFDTKIVADKDALKNILCETKLTENQIQEAEKINLTPEITFDDKTVKVNIVTFTKWGGFKRNTYTINKNWPHRITNEDKETLVEYHCGIKF